MGLPLPNTNATLRSHVCVLSLFVVLLLILVKPPQVSFLDPQKYLSVVLVVVFVVANVDATVFLCETPHKHPQPPLQSIVCCCSC